MENTFKVAKALGHFSNAKQLIHSKNYSFHQVEKLLQSAAKAKVSDADMELANFYKKHKMFKEALYWYDRSLSSISDKNLIFEIASWYENGIGTEVNYDEAAKLYLLIAHFNNEALVRLMTLYKDKKTSYFGTMPQRNNFQYWQKLLAENLKKEYWKINRIKRRASDRIYIENLLKKTKNNEFCISART